MVILFSGEWRTIVVDDYFPYKVRWNNMEQFLYVFIIIIIITFILEFFLKKKLNILFFRTINSLFLVATEMNFGTL